MTATRFFCDRRGWMALALTLSLCIMLAGCAPARHYEAAQVLQDFAAGSAASSLKQTTPTPLRQSIAYTVAGRAHHADLYLPGPLEGCTARPHSGDAPVRCPRAALVAVPGAVP